MRIFRQRRRSQFLVHSSWFVVVGYGCQMGEQGLCFEQREIGDG